MDNDLPCKEAALLAGHQGPVRAVRFNSDGNYCITCGSDKLVKLWNPHREGGKFLKTYSGHGYEVLDVVASGDSGRLASCSADRTVVLWDVSTGQVIRRYRGHIAKVNAVKFNQPDSTVIMSASYDATVRCWDTRSRSQDPIQIIDDAKDSIATLQVSQHEILTGSVDCKIRKYDIRMGSLVVDFLGEPVTCVAISQDSQCILSSTLDSTIRLLDKETGELLNEFKGHKNKDYKVDSCFTNTDTHIISGSEDVVALVLFCTN
ncbi:WD repeat domain-containing protein 83-like isoform X2 [Actinia tenebrosa]|uniref:WD repeat domain-containing protein 83 n=1 Tax=Actinia tenebrosa TaxID=6105 RepID=A0A6P8I9N4_ACTTE|nr:WD repeat domain-containing protein 83-like isoform X2 [Actinia tenebrosa]